MEVVNGAVAVLLSGFVAFLLVVAAKEGEMPIGADLTPGATPDGPSVPGPVMPEDPDGKEPTGLRLDRGDGDRRDGWWDGEDDDRDGGSKGRHRDGHGDDRDDDRRDDGGGDEEDEEDDD